MCGSWRTDRKESREMCVLYVGTSINLIVNLPVFDGIKTVDYTVKNCSKAKIIFSACLASNR